MTVTERAPRKQPLEIAGPAGVLEAMLELPAATEPRGYAVVCHPHPLHGGTMQNKVAHTLARAFTTAGFAALRFNFRGVGKSEGSFDDGNGEVDDVVAVTNHVQQNFAPSSLWLAGFSFGAAMAIRAALDVKPAGLVSIAPAVTRFAAGLASQPACPWLVLQGDEDELVDIDSTVTWIDSMEPGPELVVLAGAEHFFHGRLVELRETVVDFIDTHASD